MPEIQVDYELIFAEEGLGAMVMARDADTGEILAVGVDLARP